MVYCSLCKAPLGRKARWFADGKPVCMADAQSRYRARFHNSKGGKYHPMPQRVFEKVLAEYLDARKGRQP